MFQKQLILKPKTGVTKINWNEDREFQTWWEIPENNNVSIYKTSKIYSRMRKKNLKIIQYLG